MPTLEEELDQLDKDMPDEDLAGGEWDGEDGDDDPAPDPDVVPKSMLLEEQEKRIAAETAAQKRERRFKWQKANTKPSANNPQAKAPGDVDVNALVEEKVNETIFFRENEYARENKDAIMAIAQKHNMTVDQAYTQYLASTDPSKLIQKPDRTGVHWTAKGANSTPKTWADVKTPEDVKAMSDADFMEMEWMK